MKFKKLLISACTMSASAGLLATILTSCSKSDIDDDLKIELDTAGKLIDGIDYKDALKQALSTESGWKDFKTALANEVILKWYENRASKDKKSKDKNDTFRSNLDEWNYQIGKDYDEKVKEYKSKYGANYKFYFQNEVLDSNGGTEASYKHAKLVEKARSAFIENVYSTSYLGMKNGDADAKYPSIFTSVKDITKAELTNPKSWKDLGFFAKTNTSFIADKGDVRKLSMKNDGDYASIQQFVFNRWFRTERPFFSAASLFKYSNPDSTDNDSLKDLFSNKFTAPDKPNEAFPFFGAKVPSSTSNGLTGTAGFYNWYDSLRNGYFVNESLYKDDNNVKHFNGSISIPKDNTEDSKTLLLCYGSEMFGGTNSLYVPYAIAASDLYAQMMGEQSSLKNSLDQDFLEEMIEEKSKWSFTTDLPTILKLFMFRGGNTKVESENPSIQTYTDLSTIYGTDFENIFKQDPNFTFFWKKDAKEKDDEGTGPIKYVTNNVVIKLAPTDYEEYEQATDPIKEEATQPWVFELNEAGVHAQTIDGYTYVSAAADKQQALKEVILFRLAQLSKKIPPADEIISCDLLESGLKKYFTDNFESIILEMALATDGEDAKLNIFKNVEDIAKCDEGKAPTLLLNEVITKSEKISNWEVVKTYLNAVKAFDNDKMYFNRIVNADKTIYNYRSTQIENSFNAKSNRKTKVYENGLTARLPISFGPSLGKNFNTSHHYDSVAAMISFGESTTEFTINVINNALINVKTAAEKLIDGVSPDKADNGFSPQIASAKKAESNRYWFSSYVVDKMMYSFMSTSVLANKIKDTTYNNYSGKINIISDVENNYGYLANYFNSKLLGDKKYSNYTVESNANQLWFNELYAYKAYLEEKKAIDGEYSSDLVNVDLIKATANYLVKPDKDGKYFVNFTDRLNKMVSDTEPAIIAYLNKFDPSNTSMQRPEAETSENVEGRKLNDIYGWSPDVSNMFDAYGYADSSKEGQTDPAKRLNFDEYWNVIPQTEDPEDDASGLAGFLGIQTSSSNSLDSNVSNAVFKKFGDSTYDATPIGSSESNTYLTGVWFPWANGEGSAKKEIYNKWNVEFKGNKLNNDIVCSKNELAAKLAYKIASCSTTDELRSLATSLYNANPSTDAIKKVATDTFVPDPDYMDPAKAKEQMKYEMINEIIDEQNEICFERVEDVELHRVQNKQYCFYNSDYTEGYKLLLTQINKSDIEEGLLVPEYSNGTFTMKAESPISLNEFWFIFYKMACDSTIQQYAISDAVNETYGEKKLIVHDAQLYNQFDSIWIKDWTKKTIGE